VLANLLNGGHVFIDKSGKIHYVRNEWLVAFIMSSEH
jgi:hypothetical protein